MFCLFMSMLYSVLLKLMNSLYLDGLTRLGRAREFLVVENHQAQENMFQKQSFLFCFVLVNLTHKEHQWLTQGADNILFGKRE